MTTAWIEHPAAGWSPKDCVVANVGISFCLSRRRQVPFRAERGSRFLAHVEDFELSIKSAYDQIN